MEKIEELLKLLNGISYKEWQAIEQGVNNEFKRLANKNTLVVNESVQKNIVLELLI